MKRLISDKSLLRYTTSAQVVWIGCIVMLWAWAFDASAQGMLLTVTATLLAVGEVAAAAGPLARAARWGLCQAGLSTGQTMSALLDGQTESIEGRPLMRLFSAASLAAMAGSLGSMAAVFLSTKLTALLSRHFLWTPAAWAVAKFAVQWVGMLPAAGGAMALLSAAALVRHGRSAEPVAAGCRQWLMATASGVTIFAGAWWFGADLLVLTMICCAVMAIMAVISWWGGRNMKSFPLRPISPARPSRDLVRKVMLTFAGLGLVLAIQMRLESEMFGVNIVGRWLWVAGSLAILSWQIGRAGRGDLRVSAREPAGAAVGAVAVIGGQTALAALSVVDGVVLWFSALSFVFLQFPLLMLAGRLISSQGRAWTSGDRAGERYIAATAAGGGLGLAFYLMWGVWPLVWLAPAGGVVIVVIVALVKTKRSGRLGNCLQWLACGAVLTSAVALTIGSPVWQLGGISHGIWLSMLGEAAPSAGAWRQEGSLPYVRTWRSELVSDAMKEVLMGDVPAGEYERRPRRGRWWVITTSDLDKPAAPGLYTASSAPDPTALPGWVRQDTLLLGSEGNYFSATQIGYGVFDGLLLAPLPADHPDAWRCYNEQTLRRCVRRIHPRGAVLLRTQASEDHLDDLMAVAATFTHVVGPSWAVAEFHDGMVDLLLAGPREIAGENIISRPSDREGAVVFASEHFQDDRMEIRRLRVLHPRGPRRGRGLSATRLEYYLQTISSKQ